MQVESIPTNGPIPSGNGARGGRSPSGLANRSCTMMAGSLKAVAVVATAVLLAVSVWPAQSCPKRRPAVTAGPAYRIAGPITYRNLAIYPIQGPRTLPNTKFLVLAEAME